MTPAPDTGRTAEEMATYVLIKRGLYWRPNAMGYTGVLAEAGLYTEADARARADGDGTTMQLASEATEFAPACWQETKIAVLSQQIAHLRAENANLRDRVREAEGAGRGPSDTGSHPTGGTPDGFPSLRDVDPSRSPAEADWLNQPIGGGLVFESMRFGKGVPLRAVIKAAQRWRRDAVAAFNEKVNARKLGSAKPPIIEFHQQDWIPGFAAFLPGATTPQPDSRAFCVLNLGSMLSTVANGDVPASDLPAFIVESMIHEVGHVLEQWAGVEFSEERVEALCDRYRAAVNADAPDPLSPEPQEAGDHEPR